MEKLGTQSGFHPGEYIRDELEARGWSQAAFALILGWRPNVVQDVIKGTRTISLDMAKALGAAFGTEPQVWMNLQAAYQLAVSPKTDKSIRRKALIFGTFPVREMQNRGWISKTDDAERLEREICELLVIQNIGDQPDQKYAARKSDDYSTTTPTQQVWLARARHLAARLSVERRFTDNAHVSMMKELSFIKNEPESIRHIPRILAKYGVRFLVVQGIKGSFIDGACFWLDKNSPCIALSLRWDRIDAFWFNLVHELGHIKYRHGDIVDIYMFGEDAKVGNLKPEAEKMADDFATTFLLDQGTLNSFISRHHPLYSKLYVMAFAMQNDVHPGIVVGQLQHKGKLPWSHLRGLLVKIRAHITSTALTDGWGHIAAL
jgi:HTH-type transcriptional regulator/antitoxin HigA